MSEQFRFDLFPLIQTERFILRSAEAGDSHDLLALYSDEAVVQYMPFTPFESVEDAQGEMNWYTKIFKENTGLRWMIEDRETRKVIGTCGFLNYEDVHNRAGWIRFAFLFLGPRCYDGSGPCCVTFWIHKHAAQQDRSKG